jgi:hypothetical protein
MPRSIPTPPPARKRGRSRDQQRPEVRPEAERAIGTPFAAVRWKKPRHDRNARSAEKQTAPAIAAPAASRNLRRDKSWRRWRSNRYRRYRPVVDRAVARSARPRRRPPFRDERGCRRDGRARTTARVAASGPQVPASCHNACWRKSEASSDTQRAVPGNDSLRLGRCHAMRTPCSAGVISLTCGPEVTVRFWRQASRPAGGFHRPPGLAPLLPFSV